MQNREGLCSVFGFLPLYWIALCIGGGRDDVEGVPLLRIFFTTIFLSGVVPVVFCRESGGATDPTSASAGAENIARIVKNMLRASRRCSNLGYVLYIVGISCLGLGLIRFKRRVVEVLQRDQALASVAREKTNPTKDASQHQSVNAPAKDAEIEILATSASLGGGAAGSSQGMLVPFFLTGVQSSLLCVFLVANCLTGVVNLCFKPLLVESFWIGLGIILGYCFLWFGVERAEGQVLVAGILVTGFVCNCCGRDGRGRRAVLF